MQRYRLEAQLGEGTMGTVYRATDLDLDRPVAVKVLKPSAFADETIRKRFIREAQVTAALSHPNLVTVFDAGQEDNTLYLVMELVEGTSLDKMMEKKDKSVTFFLEILEKVARGVHQAHERGAVHRDLKPANILISKTGVPKVTDFGLAHLMQADSGITRSGATVGTPVYMAPEQAQGLNQAISPRTDVYALGAMLYEISTSRPPHDGKTLVEIYEKIIHRPVIAPRRLNTELHPDVERIILKAIDKKPAGRYKTALEFADDVKRHLDGEPVLASAPPASRKGYLGWILAAAALLAIAVAAALLTKKDPAPTETPMAAPPRVVAPSKAAAETTTAWADLSQVMTLALRDFEDSWHSNKPQAEAEAKLRDLEPRIRQVEVRHAASTLPKAWLALAHMYLNRKNWKDELADACRGAGDDPGPWAIAALCHAATYARRISLPSIEYTATAVGVIPYQETDDLKKERLEAIAALDHIRKSPAWTGFATARHVDACLEGIQFLMDQKYPEAMKRFEAGVEDPLVQGTVDELNGYSAFVGGRFKDAVKPLERVSGRGRHRAFYTEGLTWLSIAIMESGDPMPAYENSVVALSKGIALDPEPASGFSHRSVANQRKGLAELNSGRPAAMATMDASIADAEEALKRNPALPDTYQTLSNSLQNRGEMEEGAGRDPCGYYDRAVAMFAQWSQRFPTNAQIPYCRGNVSNRKGAWLVAQKRDAMADFKRALEDYEAAIKIQPFAEAWSNRGNVFQSIARIDDVQKKDPVPTIRKAIDSYVEALKLNPKLPEALNNRANANVLLADLEVAAGRDPRALHDLAIEDYARATRAKTDYFNAWINLGNLAMKMGDTRSNKLLDGSKDYTVALDAFEHGFKLRPDIWNFYTARSYVFVRLGRREEAAACLDAGIKAFASNPTVLAQLKAEREKLLK